MVKKINHITRVCCLTFGVLCKHVPVTVNENMVGHKFENFHQPNIQNNADKKQDRINRMCEE